MATTKKTSKKTKTSKTIKTTNKSKKTVSARAATKVKSNKQIATKRSVTKKVVASVKKPWDAFQKLNAWNLGLALLHTAQGVAIIMLSNSFSQSVTTNYLTKDTLASTEGSPVLVQATRTLFDVNLAYIVAAFFFMSAIAHLVVGTVYRKRYESDLKVGINKARWIEYCVSASVMMVAIAMLAGVTDLSTLLLAFGAILVMNSLGLVMEIHNQTTKKTNWISFLVGIKSGIFPWVVVGLYLWGANQYGEGTIPSFVYWIFGSMFILFSSFAVNMYLQYKKMGRWTNYLFGEKAYMVLSLIAKSALAWQIFMGTLRP